MYYRKTKYGNRKIEIDGIKFDSVKEANRYNELKLIERAGKIKDLQMQVKFTLIPPLYETVGITEKGKVKNRLVERECSYKADFVYTDLETGETIVEDTKGFKTKDYIIKRKLMFWIHNIKIREV